MWAVMGTRQRSSKGGGNSSSPLGAGQAAEVGSLGLSLPLGGVTAQGGLSGCLGAQTLPLGPDTQRSTCSEWASGYLKINPQIMKLPGQHQLCQGLPPGGRPETQQSFTGAHSLERSDRGFGQVLSLY